MKIKIKRAFWKIKNGYFHAPILGFSYGSTGFIITVPFFVLSVVWKEVTEDTSTYTKREEQNG